MPNRVLQILVFVALASGGFAIGTTEFGTMSLLPMIQRAFSVDDTTASHIISAYALGVVVGAPVITVIAARISRKPLLVGLMLLFAAGNALSAVAPSFDWLILFRFLSGLPHGAYFGLASLMAASVVKPERKTQAVGYVMLGLTLATIIGVPAATWLAHLTGWRAGYWSVTGIAILACLLITLFAPYRGVHGDAHPLRELKALARPNVWLTLSIGAIGFGGVFAVYTYLTTTLSQVTHMSSTWVPVVLAVFGVGMTVGNMVVPWFADRAQMPTAGVMLVWSMLALLAFPFASHNAWTVTADVFLIGIGVALAAILQARLMDVAGDAQNLAAALNHVAFNAANALGPFLAGLVIAYGYGTSTAGYVGAALCVAGLMMWGATWAYDHHAGHDPHADRNASDAAD